MPVSSMPGRPYIAIVGAGPAGLVLAHLLQQEDIPFVVFERQELADLRRRPKAGLIEYRTGRPSDLGFSGWSGRREPNPHDQLGRSGERLMADQGRP